MAKITFLSLPLGIDLSMAKGLSPADRFGISRLRRQVVFQSRKRRSDLTSRSLLPQVKADWATLTTAQQEAWGTAGANMNLNGYRMYVKDRIYRLKNELTGEQVPSVYYQNLLAHFTLSGSATSLKITQLHPEKYWVSHKVSGTKNTYEPVQVTEDFALPLRLEASYKTSLTSSGSDPYARFYAIVYSLYQGRTIENLLTIEIPLSTGWASVNATLSSAIGAVKSYVLFIELHDVQGDLYLDNLRAIHSAQNWLRDPYCNSVRSSFTRAFYQIPRHWAVLDLPDGAFYDSVYFDQTT